MNRYLGEDPEQTIAQVRQRDSDWFAFSEEVAAFTGDLINRMHVPDGDQRLLLAALLYGRVAAAFETVIVLAERGMHTEGRAIRRLLLEALFILCAIKNQPSRVNDYLDNDKHRLRDILMKIDKLNPRLRDALAPELSAEIVEQRKNEFQTAAKGITYMRPEQYAQDARLYDIYLTDYSFLSEATHHVAKDVERHIATNADGDIDGMYWGPERELPSTLLAPAVDHVLLAAQAIDSLFGIGVSARSDQLREKAEAMLDVAGNGRRG